jgi:hypothetical protein
MNKTNFFLSTLPFSPWTVLATWLEQNFTMGLYGVGIGHAWYSRNAREICSSLVQIKKLKKNYFSPHKLPRSQSTNFWSQGIFWD